MAFDNIVVTGGTGFVGSRVVEALQALGSEVHSCDRSSGVDLRDGQSFGRFLSDVAPDSVVHCAAHVGGLGYVGEHAIEVFEDNLQIGTGLMQGMRAAGVSHLVTVMPNCTYPGDKDLYREEQWWDGAIHDSVLMYGLPRKTLWALCKTYGTVTGLKSAHLIFPNMYGPGDHFEPKRSHALGALIKKIVTAKRQGEQFVDIWGSGRPVREWMHVQDAAGAIARFVEIVRGRESVFDGHPIFNVGIAEGVSIAALARMIREAVGWDGSFRFDRARPDGAMRKLLDGHRFEELTGWTPSTALHAGIEQTVAWYEARCEPELIHAH